MGVGDALGNLVLGGGHGRTYTPAEQAAYDQRFPGAIIWIGGVPYVTQPDTAPSSEDTGPNPQFSGQTGRENAPGALVEADLSDPSFLAQLARFAGVTSAAEFGAGQFGGPAGAAGGGGGGVSSSLGAAATPSELAAGGGGAMVPAGAAPFVGPGAAGGLGAPSWMTPLIGAAANAPTAIASSIQQRKAREKELAAQKDLANQRVAADESQLDPFRQQMAQAGDMARLDRLAHASYDPITIDSVGSRATGYQPKLSGGSTYQPGADVRAGAEAIKQSVMKGQGAPTMTNPANYGKTSALDLTAPGTPPATATPVAPTLTQLYTGNPNSAVGVRANKNAASRRAQEIQQWEQQNPGWTIDPTTGQPKRRAAAGA